MNVSGRPGLKTVLSASRRTDIPAFYMPWFMAGIEQGLFLVENPFNGRVSRVPATPDHVHTIVFWSKDYGFFLDNAFGEILQRRGYHLFFNFTVNSRCPQLEPNLPPLAKRLEQLAALCARFSPQCVSWRFDPICVFTDAGGNRCDNLGDFLRIAETARDLGIGRCITSFIDLYPKVRRRARGKVTFLDLPQRIQRHIVLKLHAVLRPMGIALELCCEKELLATLPRKAGVKNSRCIPNERLATIFGGDISLAADPGQRRAAGCGCGISRDIGSYRQQPCFHNCLFCYANPAAPETAGSIPEGRIS